ncbi:hypothetical protein MF406_17050 [Georgenia sp. TF02-10]|uniref:FitA-like ribbon-helix-helix domain-containing protein n=1 Tax=Georgenia sp. TF02-10 TaxID=2917725 RepID=UPI001FA74C4F|nr:hypothetical protein [Georgenia sp. TF02-10]UNX54564.1 hypothetical protein MF406_17050 [Georgenia sp. TF02-10]
MGVSITVRDVPEPVRDELAARAARSGRSLQEYLRMELTALSSRPSPEDVLARIRRSARAYPPVTADELVSDLDADRR